MTASQFVEKAQEYLGYKARPGGSTEFGQRAGYNGQDLPWDGSFVDCVAFDSGLQIPSCVYTPAALAAFASQKRWRANPRPGDIVFYAFPSTGTFGAPHVGIVVDSTNWRTAGNFIAIEANIDSGLPRGSKDKDGIHERLRWKNEVIGFCRPNFKLRPVEGKIPQTGRKIIKIGHIRPEKRHESTVLVQKALKSEVSLAPHEPGVFDLPTRMAYAQWQRKLGRVGPDANSTPTQACLAALGARTGLFSVDTEF
jgi:hypothetical protein